VRPAALRECKRLISDVARARDRRCAEHRDRSAVSRATRRTDDGQEGIAAFLDKRKPRWVPQTAVDPRLSARSLHAGSRPHVPQDPDRQPWRDRLPGRPPPRGDWASRTVAVYSDADATSRACRRLADEAYRHRARPPPRESYLRG
jgi:hypothetical protein